MEVTITTKENSFVINDVQCQKGSLGINTKSSPLITIGMYNTSLSELTCDGQKFDTAQDFLDWADGKLFYDGGSTGGNGGSVTWSNISGKPTGTDRQVMGFAPNGQMIPLALGWKQFSDQPQPPEFPISVLVFNSELEEGNQFGFGQLTRENTPFTIPFRNEDGRIDVGEPEFPENAVNLAFLQMYVEWFSQSLNITDTDNYTDPPTKAEVNAKYPDAKIRTTIYFKNVGGGSLKYIKLDNTEWETSPYSTAQ